jgi:cytochrome bd ubiquinol oxidase subunit I
VAAWLVFLETLSLATGRPVFRRLFDFWLGIFGVVFGLGAVTSSAPTGASCRAGQGAFRPLLGYESFTVFCA